MNNEIILKKKKWYKKKWPYFVFIFVLLIAGGVYWQYQKAHQPVQYDTVKVLRGTIKQTVDATGNIESASDLDLRFEASGRVARIYKKVNDTVKQGDLLMDLDLAQLNAAVAQAQAGVTQAQANLNKQLAGNTSEHIASLTASLDKAQADLRLVQGEVPGAEDSKLVANEYDDTVAVLQTVQNVLASSLTAADNILGVDNATANDDYESVLSVLDSSYLSMATSQYKQTKIAKNNFDITANVINNSSLHSNIDQAVVKAEESLLKMKDLLFAMANVLDKTIPLGNLTQAELDVLKTSIATARTTVATNYSTLTTQKHSVETARNSYYSYQALIDKAQADLNDAKNPPREVDVAAYRAALQSADASLAQAVANRDKARIVAPTAGIVGKILPKVGEFVSSQDVAIKLVNPHFEVKVDIPETDIVKLSINDTAEIKLDAYGDEVRFKGVITQIEKGQTVIQDVVYYRVTVSLEDDKTHQIYSGMTANIIFATEQKDDVLYIPARAVKTLNGEKTVRILEQGLPQETTIKTGLRGDGGTVEVVEGLSEGEDVVLGTK